MFLDIKIVACLSPFQIGKCVNAFHSSVSFSYSSNMILNC